MYMCTLFPRDIVHFFIYLYMHISDINIVCRLCTYLCFAKLHVKFNIYVYVHDYILVLFVCDYIIFMFESIVDI